MESTMRKYARRIEGGEVNPHLRYDGKRSGLILDPSKEKVPLQLLGFGIFQLRSGFKSRKTEEKEMVIVPQEGRFEAKVNGNRYPIERIGGPFAPGPGNTNAPALNVSCDSEARIQGKGEIVFFEAPAIQKNPPFYLPQTETKVVSRGEWLWRRDVIPLISPKNGSSTLVVGETYSPPGLW